MVRKALVTSIAVLACAAPAAQAAPTWLAPGLITGADYPAVAMNDAGTTALALATSGSVMSVALHQPGDTVFSSPLPASPAGSNAYVNTDVNARGDVALGWDDGARAWAAIKPAGGAFGAPIDLGPATSGSFYNVQVQLADNGDLVAAWDSYESSAVVKHWIVKPAGGPLGALGSAVTNNLSYGGPRLAVDGAGDAVATWTQYNGSHWYVREVSRPAGGSFGTVPVTLSDTSQDAILPYAAISANGGAAVAWTQINGANNAVQLSRRTSAGGDFGLPINLSWPGTAASALVVAANRSGELVVAWGSGGEVQARLGSLTDAFNPAVSFEGYNSPPQAAISDTGEAIVTWGLSNTIRASLRAPGGAFRAPFDVSTSPASYFGTVPAAPVAADADGDIVTAWMQNTYGDTAYRVFDAAGPQLDGLTVPGSATAGTAAAFSVAPLDAFSPVASTHWDFGDGAGADGTSVSHAFASTGSYTVKVTSTDAVGNATSATKTITVSSAPVSPPPPAPPAPPVQPKVVCKVPNLKGLAVTKAKKKLTAAHCKLGRTTTPKKLRKARGLVIAKQTPKSGTVKPNGFKVIVTLGKKPKAARR